MSHYYNQHHHTNPTDFHQVQAANQFGVIVGTVEIPTERPITGRSGEHLQFRLEVRQGVSYEVDVNIKSSDGTPIQVCITSENLQPGSNPGQPFGAESYGLSTDASLSYRGLGLTNAMFKPIADARIQSLLEAALNSATFVAVYGQVFNDGGPYSNGIHETHFTGHPNQDGGIAIYSQDAISNQPKRTWFFFKFQNDDLSGSATKAA